MGSIHYPGGRFYIDRMTPFLFRDLFLAPQQGGSFLSYAPQTQRTVKVWFRDGKSGPVMMIESGTEIVTAKRIRVERTPVRAISASDNWAPRA